MNHKWEFLDFSSLWWILSADGPPSFPSPHFRATAAYVSPSSSVSLSSELLSSVVSSRLIKICCSFLPNLLSAKSLMSSLLMYFCSSFFTWLTHFFHRVGGTVL